jgi:hypothetical protein
MHPDVLQMRSFRDNKVSSSFTGENFVNIFLLWYYSWSPPVARIISGSNLLRGIFRIILTPLVYTMRLSETMYDLFATIPELAACVSVSTAAALCGVFYIAPMFIVLNRIGVRLSLNRRSVLLLGLFMLFLSIYGSLVGSIFVNVVGFTSFAVLVTVTTGFKLSKITKQIIYKPNR